MTERLRIATWAMLAAGMVTACSPDGGTPSPLPSRGETNSPPRIVGQPASQAIVGSEYVFQPTGTDSDGDPLVFSVMGLPTWALFDVTSGRIRGTPTTLDAGIYSGIVISVSDGALTARLPSFGITVLASPSPSESAALSWTAPSAYTDGSLLPSTHLAAYRIYHGTSEHFLERIAEVDSTTHSITIRSLEPGTHFFAVTSVTSSGAESNFSTIARKTVHADVGAAG